MVVIALVEVCGSIIVGLTRGVAEHYTQMIPSLIQRPFLSGKNGLRMGHQFR